MWNQGSKYTRVKLCWFEHLEAAYEASSIGADALGFHILRSNTSDWREKVDRFSSFLSLLPAGVDKILLCDFPYRVIEEVMLAAPFDGVQLYPDWEPSQIDRLRMACGRSVKIIKVMSAQPRENNPSDDKGFLERYAHSVDAFLLDSFREGGTGKLADLDHCAEIVRISPLPIFIAGGLNAENVGMAIRIVQPFGVDVETGVSDLVQSGTMLKNMGKCREFIKSVEAFDRQLLREGGRLRY